MLNVSIFTSAVRPFHFPDYAEGSEETNVNITGKTASSVMCGSWHCKSGEGIWDRGAGYREQVGGVRCVVSEVEGCGRVGGRWGAG